MAPRKERGLFNKCLWVEGDLLGLTWAELERGAVPVTRLCSQVHFPLLSHSSLFYLVIQKTTFPRLHCPLAWAGKHWLEMGGLEQAPLPPLLCLGSTAGNGHVSSVAPASARNILPDFSFHLVVLGPGL